MGILRAVVDTQSLLVRTREAKFAKGRAVRSQFISDNNRWDKALGAKEFPEEANGRSLVAPGLNENFQNLAFAIDRPPQNALKDYWPGHVLP
jgi:hypothetical protein